MEKMETIGQIIGGVALYFSCFRFLKTKKVELFRLSFLASLFYIIHYLLIGAIAGCYTVILATIRDLYIYEREKHHKKHRSRKLFNNAHVFIALFLAYAILIALNLDQPKNLLPLSASLSNLCFVWFISNKTTLKVASGVSTIPWLCYDIISHSYAGIMANLLQLTAIFTGTKRDKKRRLK